MLLLGSDPLNGWIKTLHFGTVVVFGQVLECRLQIEQRDGVTPRFDTVLARVSQARGEDLQLSEQLLVLSGK